MAHRSDRPLADLVALQLAARGHEREEEPSDGRRGVELLGDARHVRPGLLQTLREVDAIAGGSSEAGERVDDQHRPSFRDLRHRLLQPRPVICPLPAQPFVGAKVLEKLRRRTDADLMALGPQCLDQVRQPAARGALAGEDEDAVRPARRRGAYAMYVPFSGHACRVWAYLRICHRTLVR